MEKGTLPKNRKRWIDFLPDEVYNSLKQTDKDNLLHFQRLSKSRVQKELKLKKLKEEIKELRKSISDGENAHIDPPIALQTDHPKLLFF